MNLPESMKKNLDIYFRNYLKQKASQCKICNGTLIVEGEDDVRNCPECIDKTVPNRNLIYANIGMEYLNIEVADVEQVFSDECAKGLFELSSNIAELIGKANIFIHRNGDNHSYGTSTAGMILLKELIRKGHEGFVINSSSLIDYFLSFGDESVNLQKKEMLDFVQFIPILCINDLGKEFKRHLGKEYLYNTFINFLGKRKMNSKMTIITTEMTAEEFDKEYPGALSSHVQQHFIHFNIRCSVGKNKQSAATKFNKEFGDKMPLLAKYLKKEPFKRSLPKQDDTPETVSEITGEKTKAPNKFMGTNYRSPAK